LRRALYCFASELALNRAESVKLPHYRFARPVASICARPSSEAGPLAGREVEP